MCVLLQTLVFDGGKTGLEVFLKDVYVLGRGSSKTVIIEPLYSAIGIVYKLCFFPDVSHP